MVSETGCRPSACSGVFAPDNVVDVGWPSVAVDAGRKEPRVDKVEVLGREREWPIQVINLHSVMLATVTRGYTSNQTGTRVDEPSGTINGCDHLL